MIRRCYDHLKPGGWIEIPDVTIGTYSDNFDWRDESSALMHWYQCYRRGTSAIGIDGFANKKRAAHLAAAHFTQISEKFSRATWTRMQSQRSRLKKSPGSQGRIPWSAGCCHKDNAGESPVECTQSHKC